MEFPGDQTTIQKMTLGSLHSSSQLSVADNQIKLNHQTWKMEAHFFIRSPKENMGVFHISIPLEKQLLGGPAKKPWRMRSGVHRNFSCM